MAMIEVKIKPKKMSLLIHAVDDLTAPVDFAFKNYYLKDLNIGISSGANYVKISKQGIYYYTNLPDGVYTITLSSPLFVTERRTVTVTTGNPSELLVRMKPGYDYKIYGTVACIRGIVVDSLNNRPVEGVRVRALPRTEEAMTDEKGRYLVYIKSAINSAGETIDLTFDHLQYQGKILKLSLFPLQRVMADTLKLMKL